MSQTVEPGEQITQMAEPRRGNFISLLIPRFSKSLGSKTWKNNTDILKRRMRSDELILWSSVTLVELELKRSQQLDLNKLRVSNPETVTLLQISVIEALEDSGEPIILQLKALVPNTLVAQFPNLRDLSLRYVLIAKEEIATLHSLCNCFNSFNMLFYRPKNWLAEKESVKCLLESSNFLEHKIVAENHIFRPTDHGKKTFKVKYEREAFYFNLLMRNPRNYNLLSHVSSVHLFMPKDTIHLLLSALSSSSLRSVLKYLRVERVRSANLPLAAVSFLREFVVEFTEMRYFCIGRSYMLSTMDDTTSYLCHYFFIERSNLSVCLEHYRFNKLKPNLYRRCQHVLSWYGEQFYQEVFTFETSSGLQV